MLLLCEFYTIILSFALDYPVLPIAGGLTLKDNSVPHLPSLF